jgi:hypothetical protein
MPMQATPTYVNHTYGDIKCYRSKSKVKSKAIPVSGSGGVQGYEMLMIPYCLDNRFTDGVQPHAAVALYSSETFSASGTQFC